jgi:hypothetical protein
MLAAELCETAQHVPLDRRAGEAAVSVKGCSASLLTDSWQYAVLGSHANAWLQEIAMPTIHVDIANAEWTSAVPFYGPNAIYDGRDIVQLKVLSDRRSAGGGIA